jgi:hypothetical protein
MNFSELSDPTLNRNFGRFWNQRDPFFRNETAADLDRRADAALFEGQHRVAERLSRRAAEMRAEAAQ